MNGKLIEECLTRVFFMDDKIKKLIDILQKKFNKKIDIILIGGQALPYYSIFRTTKDLDFEINNLDMEDFVILEDALDKEDIHADFAEDISTFGFIPLPEGYKQRAIIVYEDKKITVKVLEPVDYIISKLFRGAKEDEEDIKNVIKSKNIKIETVENRINQIKFLKDTETFNFLKRTKLFLNELKKLELEDDFAKDLSDP